MLNLQVDIFLKHIGSFQKISILPLWRKWVFPSLRTSYNNLSKSEVNFTPTTFGWHKFPPWGDVDLFWDNPFQKTTIYCIYHIFTYIYA